MTPISPEQSAWVDFDRELSLKELLAGINQQRLLQILEAVLEAPAYIRDTRGECLVGDPIAEKAAEIPVHGELEAIGYLCANASAEKLKTAGAIIQQLLYANSRYLMASDIHLQTQREDYEELQRKHAALEQSEMRYKCLAESLEERVKQQVKTIQATQLKLYESEKLASVGRLAAGMAHEINNPLGFIRSNLSCARSYLEPLAGIDQLMKSSEVTADRLQKAWLEQDMSHMQEDLQDIFQESIEGVERIAAIIKDLKGFSRINDSATARADINEIIRQTCSIAVPQLSKDIRVIQKLASDIPDIDCDAASLGQVFHHLLLNAADAISGGGTILFKTSSLAGKLMIEVRDTGSGIAESVLPNVFDAFYTTKEVGKGKGLGLTVCHHVINVHQGEIRIKSKPGQGTLVLVILPITNTVQN